MYIMTGIAQVCEVEIGDWVGSKFGFQNSIFEPQTMSHCHPFIHNALTHIYLHICTH